jgi:hypothetical protein
MKIKSQLILLLVVLATVLMLTGCEKDGAIRIINRTSHNVYAGILGQNYTIPGDSSLKVHVTTGTQGPFDSSVGRYVELYLQGETYQIWNPDSLVFVDKTTVWVNAGNTTSAYLDPNRACVKVINQTTANIKRIIVQRNTAMATQTVTYELDPMLAPGGAWYKQQVPADLLNPYYYLVQVIFEDDTTLTYGDSTNILHSDDEFLIHVLPPEKH